MGSIARALPLSARPITLTEFANALFSTWEEAKRPPFTTRNLIFGLAVSGGVDSMALAALCARLQRTSVKDVYRQVDHTHHHQLRQVLLDLRFQAFIVDHGARQGSDVEARTVLTVLQERGIHAKIIRLESKAFGNQKVPNILSNFESLARIERFQKLGAWCRRFKINSLLLAHHEDDQAETVLMRMIAGHRGSGLQGIRSSSEIPECWGTFGLHESSGPRTPAETEESRNARLWLETVTAGSSGSSGARVLDGHTVALGPLRTESGGIRLYRPLLCFSKERLIATCEAEGMPWFEDLTNQDPTLTTRNAIRHMFSSHGLPSALSKPALLQLRQKVRRRDEMHNRMVKFLLQKCEVKCFETRVGTLILRFVDPIKISWKPLKRRERMMACLELLLRRLILLVTPQEHVQTSSLQGAVHRILPHAFDVATEEQDHVFTVAGIQFKRLSPTNNEEDPSAKYTEWFLSRQPHTSSPQFQTILEFTPWVRNTWSKWRLYDGRFWIRIYNLSSKSILVRPFREQDMKPFTALLSEPNRKLLKARLRLFAPAKVRWTLPVIVIRGADGDKRVLALPTLDVSIPDCEELVEWKIAYKKVDLDGLMTPKTHEAPVAMKDSGLFEVSTGAREESKAAGSDSE